MSILKEGKLRQSLETVKQKLDNRFFKYALPFFVFVVGGSFGLKFFTSLRYEYRKTSAVSRKELEEEGIQMKKPEEVTLEAIYDEVQKLDIDTWTNVRGPRPWEEPVRPTPKN